MPAISLILANIVALVGVLFFSWDLHHLIILYWAELALIGVYASAKLVVLLRWESILAVPVYLGMYGFFMFMYLFVIEILLGAVSTENEASINVPLVADMLYDVWPVLFAMFISHGISFGVNFIGRQEYKRVDYVDVLAAPFIRIALVQLTIILLIFPVVLLARMMGTYTPLLAIFIAAKTYQDIKAHIKSHDISGYLKK